MINVYNTETEKLMQLEMETYIAGVVAAEMPASFELDALKAQAVAARTFALKRMNVPNSNVKALHSDAQISTSPTTCQAWISDDEQRERWGKDYTKWHQKIIQAVTETAGEVLCYDGVLIDPVYHASCGGGATESAEYVWGNAKPYLVSVPCNHPADQHSGVTMAISQAELMEKLDLQSNAVNVIAEERTPSNRLKTMLVGDNTIRGSELRNALGLKSTLIDWLIIGDQMIVTTNGYGHGAGMCQNGANYYAQLGYNYQQILQHYYRGAVVQKNNKYI
ncbi:MAG: stage II sporulation protein D [Peptococcaceae bacterium]|nr:stage II sporulation protein D [Peptococcaceae bacterium]